MIREPGDLPGAVVHRSVGDCCANGKTPRNDVEQCAFDGPSPWSARGRVGGRAMATRSRGLDRAFDAPGPKAEASAILRAEEDKTAFAATAAGHGGRLA